MSCNNGDRLEIGNQVRLTANFQKDSVYVDPSNIFLEVINPSNVTTTLQYLVDVALTKVSTGIYSYLLDLDLVGAYKIRWYSTGVHKASIRRILQVT